MPIILSIKRALALVLLMGGICVELRAQGSFQSGFLGSMNLNKAFREAYDLNVKWENRLVGPAVDAGAVRSDIRYELSDLSLLFARKVGLSAKLAGGYLWRIRNGEHHHRFMQQYLWVVPYRSFRMAWRVASDQTFGTEGDWVFRLRCRAGAEVPLNGQVADPGEWYWKLQAESLGSWMPSDFQPELRAVSLFGYEFSERNKLELGADYRLRSFDSPEPSSQLWLNVNWYVKL